MERSLLVAGATGLIGSEVMTIAAEDHRFGQLIAWGRKPIIGLARPVEYWGPSGGDLLAGLRPARVDAVICCLGTTMRNVKGNRQAFIHVDHDLVVGLGRWASGKRTRFAVVSALGADTRSSFFYNRVKGGMEAELKKMDFAALHLFQPGILDGPRSESRPGERIGLAVMKAVAPLLPVAYRPMPYRTLALALVNTAAGNDAGREVLTYKAILEKAR